MKKRYVLEIDEARLKELGTTVEEEMRWVADNGITYREVEAETVWRLQEVDFLSVMDDLGITDDKERDELLDRAHERFNIETWSEDVTAFIECHRK